MRWVASDSCVVVYGSFPTSNHNSTINGKVRMEVVYGSFPTSNHNVLPTVVANRLLFMGLFLHQTTTESQRHRHINSCLWVFSYIKPQHKVGSLGQLCVVYGSFPTSNHNQLSALQQRRRLFMGLFLHQTTTAAFVGSITTLLFMGLFLHQTTT